MADDETVASFVAFTSASDDQARQYLQLSDNNLEAAVQLFFENPDLGNAASSAPSAPSVPSRPSATHEDPINVDDDDDVEDDEAMARRLQQEMYGGGGPSGGGADGMSMDEDGVRAPMARRTEALVGPDSDWRDDPNEMRAAVMEQMMQRQRRRAAPGIFNQRDTTSIWAQEDPSDPERHREALARATGGASEATQKSNHLANLFRPPFDIMCSLPFGNARDEGKENNKWILVNLQDPSIFDCQVLNRDLWKESKVVECIKEHFLFLQYNKDDPKAADYVRLYFANSRDNEDMYPHISIVDPRTGEQVKTWSGSPAPKADEFLMDLYEFLDRYSLDMMQKNPVQTKRKEQRKDPSQMTEDEMLDWALRTSVANGSDKVERDEDPDALTDKGKARASVPEVMDDVDMGGTAPNGSSHPATGALGKAETDTPFSRISSTSPHEEPPATEKDATRIQFRYSGGRVVRRFLLNDPVQRIYEWLKASPLEGTEGKEFELIAMPRANLIDKLEQTVGEAGLRNASVMVEVTSDEGDD